MNWDEDVDLLIGKKTSAKQGRRAGSINTPPDSAEAVFTPPEAPRRKTGGWAEETTKTTKSKSGGSNLIEQERFQAESPRDKADDIPEIPDIDDLQDDALNLADVTDFDDKQLLDTVTSNLKQKKIQPQKSQIKSYVLDRVVVKKSTYKELDNQFEHLQTAQPSFGNLGDIDLSFLTNKLYPEKDVQQPNEVWTMESLYRDIKSFNSGAE